MTRNITLLWIEAGKLLADNPAALVSCPVCTNDILHVTDHPPKAWGQVFKAWGQVLNSYFFSAES